MRDIVERLRDWDGLTATAATRAANDIERLRKQIAAKDAALREIAYLDSPQVRGLPRRRSIHDIATEALAAPAREKRP